MAPDGLSTRTSGTLDKFDGTDIIGSASHSVHRADIPFASPDEGNAIQDPLSSWMHHSGNPEHMWFDDDLVSALMEPIMMPSIHNQSMDTAMTTKILGKSDIASENMKLENEPQSPPNEASEEDRWPYSWDPCSRAITACKPIQMDITHPLRQNHNTKFDISAERYKVLKSFLQRPARKGFDFHSLPLPELGTAPYIVSR